MRKLSIFLLFVAVFAACQKREQPAAPQAATTTTQQATTTTVATQSQPAATTDEATADIGQQMPPYSTPLLDGKTFDLASRKDKVVLLNLWATWCGPCVYEIPELQQIHNKYAPRGFEVVGVSVDEGPVEQVREFAKEKKMTYTLAIDPEGKLANVFQTSVLPTTVLVDRTGKVVWKKVGAIMPGDTELEKAIESAL
jgi:peroxiredoxin